MWGLNLKSLNQTETVTQARLLGDTFYGTRSNLTKHVKLVNVEIGNEPDVYGPSLRLNITGPLGPEWDMYNYTDTWPDYAEAISAEIDFGCPGSGLPTLSPGAYTSFNTPEWTEAGTLAGGILYNPKIRCTTSQFTGHAYSGVFDPQVKVSPGQLMDKATIRANMTQKVAGVRSTRAMGLKYILVCLDHLGRCLVITNNSNYRPKPTRMRSECSSHSSKSPRLSQYLIRFIFSHGYPDLSNTVESAIWAVDWLLLGASSGVERLHFHHGIGFRYNTIQPVSSSDGGLNITHPHILPSYYAFLIVNESIGTSGNSYVAEISTTTGNLTAYGVWEDAQLARLVVLNSQVYLGEGESPVLTFILAISTLMVSPK